MFCFITSQEFDANDFFIADHDVRENLNERGKKIYERNTKDHNQIVQDFVWTVNLQFYGPKNKGNHSGK